MRIGKGEQNLLVHRYLSDGRDFLLHTAGALCLELKAEAKHGGGGEEASLFSLDLVEMTRAVTVLS